MENKKDIYQITNEESKRINILKVWLAIMVVFIHSYSEGMDFTTGSIQLEVPYWLETIKYLISQAISRCAVPTYFLISAVFLYRKEFTWKGNLKKKIKTLLVPYLVANTFWICFLWLIQQIDWVKTFFPDSYLIISEWEISNFINAYIGYTGNPVLYPLWFIRDLFVLNILAKIIRKLIDKFPKIIFGFLLLMWVLGFSTHIFCIATQALCFFCFGYYIVKYNIQLSVVDSIEKYKLLILYIVFGALDILLRGSGSIHGIVHRLCIMVGVLFWFRCVTQFNNDKLNGKLLFVSKYSFCIYLFHEMNLTVLKKLGMALLPLTPAFQLLEYFFIPIIIIWMCILFGMCLRRISPKIYSVLMGSR